MKAYHSIRRLLGCLAFLGLAGCELAFEPYEGQAADQALTSIEGLQAATAGNYHRLVGGGGGGYQKLLHMMTEIPADNAMLSGTTGAPYFYLHNYSTYASMGYIPNFWQHAYELIYGTNQVIERLDTGLSSELDQLKGENHFLRALAHYHLVQVFGRPYTQGRDNPGVPIIDSTEKGNELPARNSVGEVYDFVIAELNRAAELMTIPQQNTRASAMAAYALLSRVYLNMGDIERTIEYADRVIDSGRYQLAETEAYKRYNEVAPETRPGVIFVAKHTTSDIRGWAVTGSQYYKSPGGVGWGEVYASQSYRELLDRHPEDARRSFIVPNYQKDSTGKIVHDAEGNPVLQKRNGFPQYFMIKFSNQEGEVLLGSPAILRLAEMYLNRAEAYAKLGQHQLALDDVNRIRRRAGLDGDALYTPAELNGDVSLLDVVLEERRLELAFEGHRKFDLLRNDRPLVRTYPGMHLNAGNPGVDMAAGTQVVPADHPRVIQFIPENEIELNPNLVQNP